MSVAEVIASVLIVLLLITYLVGKQRQRRPVKPQDTTTRIGKGIDTSRLTPRLKQIRHDYLARPRAATHDLWYRQRLLASVGRAVYQSSFFLKRKHEEENTHGDSD